MSSTNPLLPKNDDTPDNDQNSYLLPSNNRKTLKTDLTKADVTNNRNAAAELIRQKVAAAYATEPDIKDDLVEDTVALKAEAAPSKHQQFLLALQESAKSVADIQTEWHNYYSNLPESEKHEVWQEFYSGQAQYSRYAQFSKSNQPAEDTKPEPAKPSTTKSKSGAFISSHAEPSTTTAARKRLRDARTTREIKAGIKDKVSAGGKLHKKHHLQSVFFGLSMGGLALLIVLFGLFNEMVIAPFIQPSRNVSATPIIVDNSAMVADGIDKVIIPKINVEIPVDYGVNSMSEDVIQKALNSGTIHYPATVKPGEQGNTAIFGHSSNNIFNPGKYKFAFVLLSKLEDGDMFYLTRGDQVYAYRVFKQEIVSPTDTWVLNPVEGKTATAALITCDPPGTTINRLVVWGEQISPNPSTATASSQPQLVQPTQSEADLPGAPESLWSRINPFD